MEHHLTKLVHQELLKGLAVFIPRGVGGGGGRGKGRKRREEGKGERRRKRERGRSPSTQEISAC